MPQDLAEQVERLNRRLERERRTRMDAEAIAERGLRDLYDKQRQLQMLEQIAVAANQIASITETLQFAITTVCGFTGWMMGHAFFVEAADGGPQITSSEIWHIEEGRRSQEFRDITQRSSFSPGVGLPGKVLASGEPVWVADVAADTNFPRAIIATQSGIQSAFAFPVLVGTEVVAVLEFFADKRVELDDVLLRLMRQVGTQLGRAVERKRAEDRLIHDATHDLLTNLPNRSLLLKRLESAFAALNEGRDFALLFIDVDRFKVVNDSLGHPAGDELVVQVAARLRDAMRAYGLTEAIKGPAAPTTLARLGGDEFVVLLGHGHADAALVAADCVQTAMEPSFFLEGKEVYATASVGVVPSAHGHVSADAMLRSADIALYRAKANGRARHEVYDHHMHVLALKRLTIETELRRALQRGEFVLHYQPIVRIDTGEISGFEALVRWQREDVLVGPGEFIDIAEETGLILPLGLWVLREACNTMRSWHAELPPARQPSISVNLSVRQFAQPDLVLQIDAIIRETGIDPDMVRLEITESTAIFDVMRTDRVLAQLRGLGVHLSLDDFGTGYSSLSCLHRYPLDTLKIDRSFVSRIEESADGAQMVQTIVNLATNLGMSAIAEGVETAAQLAYLKATGCAYAQGYYFARPLTQSVARAALGRGPMRPALAVA